MAVSDGETVTVVEGHGSRHLRVRRAHARRPPRATWPSAIRYSTQGPALGERPARLPTGRAPRLRPRAQRQPDERRRRWRRRRACCPGFSLRTAISSPSCSPRAFPRGAGPRPAPRAPSAQALPSLEGAFSFRPRSTRTTSSGARPDRFPAAVPRPPRARTKARGLGGRVGDPGPRRGRRDLRARDRPGRARDHRRRRADHCGSLPGEPRAPLCVFEFVYFARPEASLTGSEVHARAGWATGSPRRRRSKPTW